MSASEKTKYYGLPLFAPDDVTSWEEFNKSMVEIDRLLYIAESAGGGGGGGEIPPDLVDRVTALETEAASLAQEISNLGIVSSSHTDQINTLDAKAEELEADVSGLTSTTNELNVQVEDNTGDISVLVTKTNTLETEQTALGNDINDVQTTLNSVLSRTKTTISSLTSAKILGDSFAVYTNSEATISSSLPTMEMNSQTSSVKKISYTNGSTNGEILKEIHGTIYAALDTPKTFSTTKYYGMKFDLLANMENTITRPCIVLLTYKDNSNIEYKIMINAQIGPKTANITRALITFYYSFPVVFTLVGIGVIF